MLRRLLPPVVGLALVAGLFWQRQPTNLERVGATRHPTIREASALVRSRLHEGVYWTLNDSGHRPHLFAIERSGKLLAEYQVEGANMDWEALATDDQGNLYVADIGNNFGLLARRTIYQVKEPASLEPPTADGALPQLSVKRTLTFTYPDKPFDAEALLWHSGSLYVISKRRAGGELYRLPLDKGDDLTIEYICKLAFGPRLVTDASLSADGRRLAVTSYDHAAWFALEPGEELSVLQHRTPHEIKFNTSKLIEGCCWDGSQLLLITEAGELYQLRSEEKPK